MLYKKMKIETLHIDCEKYIFGLLLFAYILGVCLGCYFVFSSKENAIFTSYLVSKSPLKIIMYFIFALILKYSGVLSSFVCLLPALVGLQNSVYYCSIILEKNKDVFVSLLPLVLKDTSITLLLIIYITLIAYQIIEKKYDYKNDFKYFSVYVIGSVSVLAIDYAIKSFVS